MPNQADECAIEMAVKLRNEFSGLVTIVSITPPDAEEISSMYIGLGADALMRVWDDALESADAGQIAFVLMRLSIQFSPDIILCGDRAVGGDGSGLTGPLLAELLGWPFIGGLVAINLGSDKDLICSRLIERGDRQIIRTPLPVVISISPETGQPKYPAFARTRSATRQVFDIASLGLNPTVLGCFALPSKDSGWSEAKPKPKKLFTPPATASAADRMRMVMGGGESRKPQGNVIEVSAEKAAEQVLQFLRQEKLI
ncbi:MAG: hypothetical protein L0Y67_01535 [Gammaproteobacteria bacterium]|nr:hypothetical protein [Gammaproteobacteria bacterium]